VLAGSSAYADPADAAADIDRLEEITVTAQGRTENAQAVPISVASIASEAALNAGAISTDMLRCPLRVKAVAFAPCPRGDAVFALERRRTLLRRNLLT
jgi:hypothetical protein